MALHKTAFIVVSLLCLSGGAGVSWAACLSPGEAPLPAGEPRHERTPCLPAGESTQPDSDWIDANETDSESDDTFDDFGGAQQPAMFLAVEFRVVADFAVPSCPNGRRLYLLLGRLLC